MEVTPIKKRADYRRALKEIEGLMGAKRGTSDGDRLRNGSWPVFNDPRRLSALLPRRHRLRSSRRSCRSASVAKPREDRRVDTGCR